MNKLSDYHKKCISEGLRSSKEHEAAQANKNVDGNNNPNWRSKLNYTCPICGKVLKLTQTQYNNYVKSDRACSKKCGNIKTSRAKKCRSNPGASKYMKENNPMKKAEVAKKQSKTLSNSFASGRLEELREKLRIAGAENLRGSNMKDSTRKAVSERMKNDNPMKRKEVACKVSTTMKRKFRDGEITPPELSGSRFNRGCFIDRQGQKHHYDSGWELERMQFLNSCAGITWTKNKREVRIQYSVDGEMRTYFPDFIVKYKGKTIIEEVGDWMENKSAKIQAAEQYISCKDWYFIVLNKQEQMYERTW